LAAGLDLVVLAFTTATFLTSATLTAFFVAAFFATLGLFAFAGAALAAAAFAGAAFTGTAFAGVAFAAAVFVAGFLVFPKAELQPEAYLSLVPTRVIVTCFNLSKQSLHCQKEDQMPLGNDQPAFHRHNELLNAR